MKTTLIIRNLLERFGITLRFKSTILGLTPIGDVALILWSFKPSNYGTVLVRAGDDGDGGYLVPNDFHGITSCFSPGSNQLCTFEDFLGENYNIKSYICDSIDQKPKSISPFLTFTDAWLGPATEGKYLSLADWISNSNLKDDGDLILQIDIEGAEYLALLATPISTLNKFRIIVIEFHSLESLKNRWAFELIYKPLFEKLNKSFDVVHSHPNNCCGTWSYGDMEFPQLLEVTYHRKDRRIHESISVETPHALDSKCVKDNKEIQIDWRPIEAEVKKFKFSGGGGGI